VAVNVEDNVIDIAIRPHVKILLGQIKASYKEQRRPGQTRRQPKKKHVLGRERLPEDKHLDQKICDVGDC